MQFTGNFANALQSRSSPTHQSEKFSAREKLDKNEPPGLREGDLEGKVVMAYRSITEMYNELKHCTIDEISRTMGIDPVTLWEKEKDRKPDLDTMINGLKYFLTRMLKYHVSVREIGEKKRDRGNLAFGHEEILPIVEGELKTSLREQEKLKLLLDTAHLKIKHLEKKLEETQSQSKKIVSETQNEKMKLKTQLKSQNDQLKLLQEENLIIKRPTTTGGSTSYKIREAKSYKDGLVLRDKDQTMERESVGVTTVKSSTGGYESIKLISTQMEQNKLHNLQTKQDLKEFRRKTEQERDKELSTKQKDLLIARLNIQVEERDKDIQRLKTDYERVFQDLKKMKEKEADREREEWNKEVLSDKNQNLFKGGFEGKQMMKQELALLKKHLRKCMIGEKKAFIKEKAFELERADYQDKMVYLQDRVTKLVRINDDLKKTKEDGGAKDRFRKKREANLNKSQTDSDDNNETRGGGGLGLETMGTIGTIVDSHGKTPKVGFEKPTGRATKVFFH